MSEDVVSRRLEEEVILVHLKTDRVYALNHTAARFWELLAAGKPLDAIEQRLAKEFSVKGEALRRGTARLLSTLREQELVHQDGSGR